MIEFTEDHFRSLCRAGPVALELSTLAEKRSSALRQFWLRLAVAILLTAAIPLSMLGADLLGVGIVLAIVVFCVGLVIALQPMVRIGPALKAPVLETLAKDGGLTYLADGFDPPVYPDARKALFGSYLSSQTFTDLFHGIDPEGRRYALYEGNLVRGSGKNRHTIFSGQMYAWQRRTRAAKEIVIVPDRGLFNFFKPLSGMERVRFEADPAFESRFEVYAYEPTQALMTVGADLRRILLELGQGGRVFGYIGGEDAFIAPWGKNRFEAGSMFSSIPGEQRVRHMFDDVCASLAMLKRLRAALGG